MFWQANPQLFAWTTIASPVGQCWTMLEVCVFMLDVRNCISNVGQCWTRGILEQTCKWSRRTTLPIRKNIHYLTMVQMYTSQEILDTGLRLAGFEWTNQFASLLCLLWGKSFSPGCIVGRTSLRFRSFGCLGRCWFNHWSTHNHAFLQSLWERACYSCYGYAILCENEYEYGSKSLTFYIPLVSDNDSILQECRLRESIHQRMPIKWRYHSL